MIQRVNNLSNVKKRYNQNQPYIKSLTYQIYVEMHFKDFTDHFYQYPHHFTYSQLLRNHHDSFVSFDKNLTENLENTNREITSSKRKFNGKMLKNIFTQLKNKTSTELEEFIDLNAAIPETSGYSAREPRKTRFETYNLNGVFLSKSTGNVEQRECTVTNPEVRISVDSEEFEHVEKSIRFVVCPKNRLGNVSGDDNEQKLEFKLEAPTSSVLKTKIGPELQEGRVFEVYNVLKRAISSVKWKYKKCRATNATNNTADTSVDTSTANKTEKTRPRDDSTDLPHHNCKCEKANARKIAADCNCWNKEDETLFCLLKLETRENYKQIKHIEQELKLQRKALKFLNNRCKSLENIVKTKERTLGRNNSDTGVQEIYIKASKQCHNSSNAKKSLDDNVDTEETFIATPNFEEDNAHTPMNTSEDTEEELTKHVKINNDQYEESNEKNQDVDTEIKEINNANRSEDLKIDPIQKIAPPDLILKSQSKIKITISRSTVVINTTKDDPTNSKNDSTKLDEPTKYVPSENKHDVGRITCHCNRDSKEANQDCMCPSKKSSFVFKLFRKQCCDPKCKCCTTAKVNKKKCKYFMEKKNKGKSKPSNEEL